MSNQGERMWENEARELGKEVLALAGFPTDFSICGTTQAIAKLKRQAEAVEQLLEQIESAYEPMTVGNLRKLAEAVRRAQGVEA